MLQCGDDPGLIREVVDGAFDIFAGSTAEELGNGLLHAIAEPIPGCLLL